MKIGNKVWNMMALLGLGVVFTNCGKTTQTSEEAMAAQTKLPIAYINTDSLLMNYEYAKVLNDLIVKKEESSRTDFNQKYRIFQQDAVEFQRKVQNNGFLSMERAQSEQQRLTQVERDLQELNTKLSGELMREQERINRELRDTLQNFLKSYSSKHEFALILSNTMGDNVLYSAPGVDITADVVKQLNQRYQVSSKK